MVSRTWVALAGAAAALTLASPALAAPKGGRLVPFRSCAQLVGYAKAHASAGPVLRAAGAPGLQLPATSAAAGASADHASSPQVGVDYSGTNVQEAGVDEPDSVKTDGDTLYTIVGNALEAVDISGKSPKLLDTLQLTSGFSHELLLSGNHLLVLSRGGYWLQPLPAQSAAMIAPISVNSTLAEVDVADPSHLSVASTLKLDGEYVTARMIGSTVRVVTSSSLPLEVPTTASKLLPTYTLGAHAARPVVQCRDVWRPPVFAGYGMLTVLTLDLAKGLAPLDTTSVMTDGRIVYASQTNLYVATEKWSVRPLPASPEQPPVSDVSTQIHDFDISEPGKTTYLGSGNVPGYLLDQWSLSDFQGVLRVVSTQSPAWWGGGSATQSYLTTLRAQGGGLVQVGQLSGLGQGERVYAVRFDGNDAYVDTFRQIDPLHAIDVSDPAHPKLMGELSIEGYSSYLHPLGNGLLLGVGQDVPTTSQSEPSGAQLTLFDVHDLAHPTRLAHVSLGPGWSNAESDHHAFLYWPATGLVVVPLNGKAEAYKVSRGGFTLVGAVAHPTGTIDRSLVDRSALVTVSDGGVQANALDTLAMLGWAPFPAQQPVPVPVPGPVQPGGPIAKAHT